MGRLRKSITNVIERRRSTDDARPKYNRSGSVGLMEQSAPRLPAGLLHGHERVGRLPDDALVVAVHQARVEHAIPCSPSYVPTDTIPSATARLRPIALTGRVPLCQQRATTLACHTATPDLPGKGRVNVNENE